MLSFLLAAALAAPAAADTLVLTAKAGAQTYTRRAPLSADGRAQVSEQLPGEVKRTLTFNATVQALPSRAFKVEYQVFLGDPKDAKRLTSISSESTVQLARGQALVVSRCGEYSLSLQLAGAKDKEAKPRNNRFVVHADDTRCAQLVATAGNARLMAGVGDEKALNFSVYPMREEAAGLRAQFRMLLPGLTEWSQGEELFASGRRVAAPFGRGAWLEGGPL